MSYWVLILALALMYAGRVLAAETRTTTTVRDWRGREVGTVTRELEGRIVRDWRVGKSS